MLLFLVPSLAVQAVVSGDAMPTQAEWISASTLTNSGPALLRRSFTAATGLVKAVLIIGADQQVDVLLNGVQVGTATGFLKAVTIDVTRSIQPGANQISLRLSKSNGIPAVRMLLEMARSDGRQEWVVTDPSWVAQIPRVTGLSATPEWKPVHAHGTAGFERWGKQFSGNSSADAYNSWMLARGTDQATDPATFSVPRGFQVDLLRTAQPGEDSWIALTFDPQGRITVAREKQGLLRLTFSGPNKVKTEVIEDALKECRGLLYAYDSLYVNANNSRGLFRLRDNDGDGIFEEKKLLLATEGGLGHARNQLRLGPDGLIYCAHGDDVVLAKNLSTNSPVQQAPNDVLLPAADSKKGVRLNQFVQLGHILQTDRDGSFFRLFATGLRNPMDVDFDSHGEMFTFEADMERDIGTPWYRPNRILQIVPGGDYGWRRGTGNIPSWSPDTLPSVVDLGVGSPTGVEFATRSQFPEPYKQALFVGDWAYGRILTVFLKPKGAGHTGRTEEFLSGRPLNVTDLTFGPDGALYFVTGGRGTRSGLYRVRWTGEKEAKVAVATTDPAAADRTLRRSLESWTLGPGPTLEAVWPHLGHADPWIRSAARRALEQIPLREWAVRALNESSPSIAVTSLLALVRNSSPKAGPLLFKRLLQFPLATLSRDDQLTIFRIYSAGLTRYGWPGDETAAAAANHLLPLFPSTDPERNSDLTELITHLRAPEALERLFPLLAAPTSSADHLHSLMWLWCLQERWTPEQRRLYFQSLRKAEQEHGASNYYSTLSFLRQRLTNSLQPNDRQALGNLVVALPPPGAIIAPVGPVIQAWTLADFQPLPDLRSRPIASGRTAFQSAGCLQCHRKGTEGGVNGPDLSAVGSRFGPSDLLEHILNPSKAVEVKYQQVTLTLTDGGSVTGIIEADSDPVVLAPSVLGAIPVRIPRNQIRSRQDIAESSMPTGLLDSLTRDQVLDLLAYLSNPVSVPSSRLIQE